jgi:hypothetical protein
LTDILSVVITTAQTADKSVVITIAITVVFEITHNWGVLKCGWKEKPRITGKPGSLGKGQVEMFLIFEAVFFCFGRAKPQKCAIDLLNQRYWYAFSALFRANKWLLRLAPIILDSLKPSKKLQK